MTSQARSDVELVRELGKYHLIAQLARGGMGDVYLAASQGPGGFNKLLAIKELKDELSEDESYVAMFLEEARLAARLIHPNIVQTNEVGSEDNHHFMVMEYLVGRSLHRVEKRIGPQGGFTTGAHLRVIADALLGLHHAHELHDFDGEPLDIVHRDMSPLNVFVTFDGQVKVLDFGIAKAVDSSLKTETGVLKGRVAYMAPEHAWGAKVDRRADVYAVGVMIWEAAARRRLWPGMADVEILARIFREGPPSLRSVRPDAPEELDALCSRAMAKYAIDRHPTAADLLDDLEAHLARRTDVITTREIGALVGNAFVDERARTTALIEKTLSRLRGGPRSGVMQAFDGDAGVQSDPHLALASLDESRSFSARRVRTPTGHRGRLLGSDGPMANAPSAAPENQTAPPPVAHASMRAVISIASALILPILGGVLATSMHRGSAPAAAAPPPVTTVLDPSPTAPTRAADATVRAGPSAAPAPEVATASAPHAVFPREERAHPPLPPAPHLAVVKHGAPTGSTAPQPSEPTPAASVTASHAEVSPAGGHAPLRPIATTNPYGDP
jgi:serine/threonine-protein kinase